MSEINPVDILLYITLALGAARLFGELFERLKFSSILGEILAGILIGGPLFALIKVDSSSFMDVEILEQFAQLGVIFLLFIVGLEINIREMRKIGKVSTIISITEVLAALIVGALGGFFILKLSFNYALFFGLLFTATSIGVTVRTLNDLNKLNTKVGRTLISVAVLDDFIALILVLIISETLFPADANNWLTGILIHIAYLVIFVIIVIFILPLILKFLEDRFNVFSDAATDSFAIGIIFAILVGIAYVAHLLEISGAIMAFLFGLSIQKNKLLVEEIKSAFIKFGEGVFIPLFFFLIGAQFSLDLATFSWKYLILIPIGVLGKTAGSFIGASSVKYSKKEALQISLGMTPRAEIALIIAEIGLINEIFDESTFSMAVVLVFVTVLITPLILRLAFREKKPQLIEKEKDIPIEQKAV